MVALPAAAVAALRPHMLAFADADQEALVFTGHLGEVLRTGNLRRSVRWTAAVKAAGRAAGFHFHDLQHTGNNLAAAPGASTRELMHRMGHCSMRAAPIYQHDRTAKSSTRSSGAGWEAHLAPELQWGLVDVGGGWWAMVNV